jgi:hypothetical protein
VIGLVDRRLLGILAIAAIIATAAVSFIFSERIERTVEVLRNDWQVPVLEGRQRLPREERRYPYTLSLVVRKPTRELLLKFGLLRNQTFDANYTGWDELTLKEKALTIQDVRDVDSKVEELAEIMDVELLEQRLSLEWDGVDYELLLLDYSSAVEALAPPMAAPTLPTLFAFLFDGSGNLSQYYSGHADFFTDRENSIEDLTVNLNENSTEYAVKIHDPSNTLPIKDLPSFGNLRFQDLGKDDRISVVMAVNGARAGGAEAIMQIIRIRLDGEYQEPIINVLIR